MKSSVLKSTVKSSMVKAAEYSPEKEILTITFNNNSKYEYENVTETLFKKLITAKSVGEYFDKYIKKQGYKYRKV